MKLHGKGNERGGVWWVVVVLVSAAVFVGCGERQAPEARGKLNIALIIPTTGQLSSYGRQCRRGAELAWREVEVARTAAGEVGFWLNIRDDHAETRPARRTARQLYKVAHFLATVGPLAYDSAAAVAEVLRQHEVTVIAPTVEDDTLHRNHPNVVQVCLTSRQIGRMVGRFVGEDLRLDTPVVLVVKPAGEGGIFFRSDLSEEFIAGLTSGGGGPTWKVVEVRDEADLGEVVQRARSGDVGAVVAPVWADAMGVLLRRLRRAGCQLPVVGGTHALSRGMLAAPGERLGEVYVAAHFAPDEPRREVEEFVEAYRREVGSEPGAVAALAYDAVKLIDEALRRSMPGGVDERGKPLFPSPAEVGRTLRSLTLEKAVTGPIAVNPDGSVTKPLVILKVDETGGHFYKRVLPAARRATSGPATTSAR